MKKSLFALFFVIAFAVAVVIAWKARETILSHFLSKELHVPVTIRKLNLDKKGANVHRLWMGNPKGSKTSTSFAAEETRIDTTLSEIFSDPLVIDMIEIKDIYVGIEFYDAQGNTSNWTEILARNESKANSKDYLIKTLILRNLTVEVTTADGKTKRYPTIPEMEFHNISKETGFPVDQIEKAIFNLMMKNLFQNLPFDQLFKSYLPPWVFP